jgi:hypothetical protein
MRLALLPIVVGLLLGAAGCKEVDDTVVIEVGTLRPSMAHPQLGTQIVSTSIDPADSKVQFVLWRVNPSLNADETDNLHLDLDGVGINLTCVDRDTRCAAPCTFADSAVTSPRATGQCASGVVVDALAQDAPGNTAVLDVDFETIEIYRLRPIALDLAAVEDFDGDGVTDEEDNCPLIDNPDQLDTGMKGFGDACAVFDPLAGFVLLDSDRDGISDLRDNCADTPNPDQADEGKPFGALMMPDGIGDACTDREQRATVDPAEFEKVLDSLNPVLLGNSWLTLDYAEAFDCDWVAGTCTLDIDAVKICPSLQGGVGCF